MWYYASRHKNDSSFLLDNGDRLAEIYDSFYVTTKEPRDLARSWERM